MFNGVQWAALLTNSSWNAEYFTSLVRNRISIRHRTQLCMYLLESVRWTTQTSQSAIRRRHSICRPIHICDAHSCIYLRVAAKFNEVSREHYTAIEEDYYSIFLKCCCAVAGKFQYRVFSFTVHEVRLKLFQYEANFRRFAVCLWRKFLSKAMFSRFDRQRSTSETEEHGPNTRITVGHRSGRNIDCYYRFRQ